MPMQKAQRQMPANAGREAVGQGEAMPDAFSDEAFCPRHATGSTGSALLQAALTTENLRRAFKRVRANKGAAGVDGLDIDQTSRLLATEWPHIRARLLTGTYRPSPVRRVTIPKPDGGERELGIPTVTDRLIQQALLQVLQPILDPTFSEHSYGFRPGRRAQDAVLAAQAYAQSGLRIVVDVDLSKFFDRVSHDILIDRLSNGTVAAGTLQYALRRAENIHWQAVDVNKQARASANRQKACVLWFTGLSGAGKSTTLAAMMDYRNARQTGHILTIEDPIEFLFTNKKSIVNQREVGSDTQTLQVGLRNALRQAPDVILIGEIRDRETMSAAIAYAQSGHLCLATLHASNSYQALNRVLNFFPVEVRPTLLSDLATGLKAIVSQRLLRKLQPLSPRSACHPVAVSFR